MEFGAVAVGIAALLVALMIVVGVWLTSPSSGSSALALDAEFTGNSKKSGSKGKKANAKAASGKTANAKAVEKQKEKEKVVTPPTTAEEPDAAVQEPALENSPTKKKKKKRRRSKENEESGDEAEEPSPSPNLNPGISANDEDDTEEPGATSGAPQEKEKSSPEKTSPEKTSPEKEKAAEWTSVPKRRERDEQEVKRSEKVQDLRRRKANISQKIARLEQGLGGATAGGNIGGRERGDCKALEARERLFDDLNRVNASIQRLLAAKAKAAAMANPTLSSSSSSDEEGEEAEAAVAAQSAEKEHEAWDQKNGRKNAEWDEWDEWGDDWDEWEDWDASQDWQSSWRGGRGRVRQRRGRGRGRGGYREVEAGGEALEASGEAAAEGGDEEWQQDWWEGTGQASDNWAEHSAPSNKRRGRRGGARYRGTAGWWESDNWEAATGSTSGSAWQVAGDSAATAAGDSWAADEWTEDYYQHNSAGSWQAEPRKRERRRRGRGSGKGADRGGDWPDGERGEVEEEAAEAQEDAEAPSASAEAASHQAEPQEVTRRKRDGKAQGGKGKDNSTPGRGAADDSAANRRADERHAPANDRFEDWLRERIGPRLKESNGPSKEPLPEAPEKAAPALESKAGAPTVGSRSSGLPLFIGGSRSGSRPNWGDEESSDEDSPISRRHRGDSGRSDDFRTSEQPAQARSRNTSGGFSRQPSGEQVINNEAEKAGGSTEESSWDEDLVAFMGEDALKDDAQFEEQLKYVPKWVAEKALRRRRQLMRPIDN